MRFHWRREAEQQLDESLDFEARKSPQFAARIREELFERLTLLATFPEIGQRELSLEEEITYRYLLIKRRYKVIYHLDRATHTIIVAAIWDCRRDPDALIDSVKKATR